MSRGLHERRKENEGWTAFMQYAQLILCQVGIIRMSPDTVQRHACNKTFSPCFLTALPPEKLLLLPPMYKIPHLNARENARGFFVHSRLFFSSELQPKQQTFVE